MPVPIESRFGQMRLSLRNSIRYVVVTVWAGLLAGCVTAARRAQVSGGEVARTAMPLDPAPAPRVVADVAPASRIDVPVSAARGLLARRLGPVRLRENQIRVVVSLEDRMLSIVGPRDTLYQTPVAVAQGLMLNYAGRTWRFQTPRGDRPVRRKVKDPVWTPPDWHYAEAAINHGLRLSHLPPQGVALSRGRRLAIRNSVVGLINPGESFKPLPTDEHIVFDHRLFVPPIGTQNRRVARTLGAYALDLGGGYLIHGGNDGPTVDPGSTHGCIRVPDNELEWLYENIPVGTIVTIR